MSHEFEGARRIVFNGRHDGATFIPRCPKCFRFVKVHTTICFRGDGQPHGPNADCKKCGPVEMPFEGYI